MPEQGQTGFETQKNASIARQTVRQNDPVSQRSLRGLGRSTIGERSVLTALTREPIQFSDAAVLVA